MGKSAILAIRIIGDATGAVTALEQVDGSAQSMQASMDKAAIGAGIALGAITAVAVQAGAAASELEQATGAVDSVFGTYAGRIHEYAETAAQDVGLAKSEYSQMAAVLGSQLKNMGVDMDDVGGQSKELIELGADLSAMFGGTTSEAVGALSSLLRGERDPIERYGVSLKQADIDAQKMAMGLDGLTGEADKAATTQATLALLTQQTSAAQGQFAREADTAAGAQQRANASWEDAQAALGEALLPIMAEASGKLSELATWVSENTEFVTLLAIAIGVLAGGILVMNGAMKAYAAVQAIQTAAQWAQNAAWLANPVTWIILAIIAAIALVVAIIWVWVENWDVLCGAVEDGANVIGDAMDNTLGWIGDGWESLTGSMTDGVEFVIGKISELLQWIEAVARLGGLGWAYDMMPDWPAPTSAASSARTASADPMLESSAMAMRTMNVQTRAASPTVATPSSAATGSGVGNTYNTYNNRVDINGTVLDREGTARDLRRILNDSASGNGSTASSGKRLIP